MEAKAVPSREAAAVEAPVADRAAEAGAAGRAVQEKAGTVIRKDTRKPDERAASVPTVEDPAKCNTR